MAENSAISWTHHTHNPWMGCQRVSPACEHCYAETLVTGRMGLPVWGPPATTARKRTGEANRREPLRWNKRAAAAGVRERVFCASLADVFEDHPALPPWRADLFALIEQTPHLDWLLLTKRPQHIAAMVPEAWRAEPRANVWMGTTVEDQRRADERIPALLAAPAAVRFLSCEPLLGPLDIEPWLPCPCCLMRDTGTESPGDCIECAGWGDCDGVECPKCEGTGDCSACDGCDAPSVDWVICGGESGGGARPMHPDWARALRDQCTEAGVPYHFKQWGEHVPRSHAPGAVTRGNNWGTLDRAGKWWPGTTPWNGHDDDGTGEAVMLRVGKHVAGHELDGRAWQEFPEVRS